MSDVLKLAAAEDLAARTLAAIGWQEELLESRIGAERVTADRERVASDLEGLRECHQYDASSGALWSLMLPHARRYSDNLHRTAALYGVTR